MKSLRYLSISLLLISCSSEPASEIYDGLEIVSETEPTSYSIYLESRTKEPEYHFIWSDSITNINDSTLKPVEELL